MAANAGKSLARLESRPAAHRLHDVAVGVEELEVDGGSRGNFEIGGSVLFDGNFSQDVFDVPRPVRDRGRHRTQSAPRGPAVSVAANIRDAEFKGDDAKRFDDAAFDTFKARPFVNVLHVIFSRRLVQIDLRRTQDRLVALGEEDRLSAADRGVVGEKFAFAVVVEPVYPEGNVVIPRVHAPLIRDVRAQKGRIVEGQGIRE